MIISTAMATIEDVKQAVNAVRGEGMDEIALLQCTGNYPARLENSNLRVLQTYRSNFNCLVGYSDHTLDIINPVAATAMGACIYEKHITIDRTLPGPDHRMSLEPEELKLTIRAIRDTELALGSSKKRVLPGEEENRIKLRKSIVSEMSIRKGQIIKSEMIAIKRPGYGIPPSDFNIIVGKKAALDISSGTVLSYEMIDDE